MPKSRKYGNRSEYNQIRKAQSRARKLARKGLISQGTVDRFIHETRINKHGQVKFGSRALNKALDDYFGVLEGYERTIKLTREQQKTLLAAYENEPEEMRPRIKNGRVIIGKHQKLSKRKGKISILGKKEGEKQPDHIRIVSKIEAEGFDIIRVDKGRSIADIESDVSDFKQRFAPHTEIGIELLEDDGAPGPLYRAYFATVEQLMEIIEEYRDSGKFEDRGITSIRLIRFSDYDQMSIRLAEYRQQQKEARKMEREARIEAGLPVKKRKPKSEKQAARDRAAMAEKRKNPAFREQERVKNKERMKNKRQKGKK